MVILKKLFLKIETKIKKNPDDYFNYHLDLTFIFSNKFTS